MTRWRGKDGVEEGEGGGDDGDRWIQKRDRGDVPSGEVEIATVHAVVVLGVSEHRRTDRGTASRGNRSAYRGAECSSDLLPRLLRLGALGISST